MKNWKIQNTSNQPIKISVILGATDSKGLILQPNEFCVSKPQLTSSMDMQQKKKFVTIDKEFDNSQYGFEEGKCYNEKALLETKMSVAERNAKEYIKKG